MTVIFIMAYLDIPRKFFINACARIQYSPSKDTSKISFDLYNKYVLFDGKRRNGEFVMFGCSGFDDKNKDIIEFCYECLKNASEKCFYPDCRYSFDGENITLNSQCQLKDLD